MQLMGVGPKMREETHSYRWLILVIVWFAFTIMYFTRLCLPPLSPFMRTELNLTNAEVGLLMSAAAAGYVCVMMLGGILSDVFGVRKLMLIGPLISGFSLTLMLFVTDFAGS